MDHRVKETPFDKEALLIAINSEGDFVATAKLVGSEARNGNAQAAFEILVAELIAHLADEATKNKAKKTFKLSMAIGLVIACLDAPEQKVLLKDYFSKVLTQFANYPEYAKCFILSELAYLDQSLAGIDLRREVHKEINEKKTETFVRSNAYIDYNVAWELVERINESNEVKAAEKATKLDGIEVLLVASVKGGVGKTITTI